VFGVTVDGLTAFTTGGSFADNSVKRCGSGTYDRRGSSHVVDPVG
jgi:hypothetical protein